MSTETEFKAQRQQFPNELQGTDFGDWNSWQHVYDVVEELRLYDARTDAATALGLPETTPWDDIEDYLIRQDRIYYAQQHGLPEDSSQEFIEAHMQVHRSEWLRAKAVSLGLTPDASEVEIHEAERQKRAKELGISHSSSWQEVFQMERERRQNTILEALGLDISMPWNWEQILRRALCISEDAPLDEVVKRTQEVRRVHIERLLGTLSDISSQGETW